MKIVLDTNILLICVSSKSPFHWIWQSIINNRIQLILSNEIIHEYEEVLQRMGNVYFANAVLETILALPSTIFVVPHYKWNIIKEDPDDNKFVDAAVSGKAIYLVSHDRHFNILSKIQFPHVNVINSEELQSLLTNT
jgi:uncharacterized protein